MSNDLIKHANIVHKDIGIEDPPPPPLPVKPPPLPVKNALIRSKIANLSLNEETYYNQPGNPFRNFGSKISNNVMNDSEKTGSVKRNLDRFNSQENLNLTGGIYQNNIAEIGHEYQSIYYNDNSIYEGLEDYKYRRDDNERSNYKMRHTFERRLPPKPGDSRQDRNLRTQVDLEKKIEEILEKKMRGQSKVKSDHSRYNNQSQRNSHYISEEDFDREVNSQVEKILSSKFSENYMDNSSKNEKPIDNNDIDEKIAAGVEKILSSKFSKLNLSHLSKNRNPNKTIDSDDGIHEKIGARLEALMKKDTKKGKNSDYEENLYEKESSISKIESRLEKKIIDTLEKQKAELMLDKHKSEIMLEKQKAELMLEKQKAQLMLEKQKAELMFEKQKAQLIDRDENCRINSKVPNWQKNIQHKNINEPVYSKSNYAPEDLRKEQKNNKSSNRPTINFSGNKGGEFQILLLGGTGTGKSTLINTMANYFLGGELPNPKVVIPTKYFKATEKNFGSVHSEASLDDVTKSKTTKCHNYSFTHPQNSGLKFVFIDSPGLSDTNGTKQDDENIQEIVNMAISAGSLAALVVIANGTEARVTPSIRNTLVRLSNNLPDVLLDSNLLLVLTKCSRNSACFSEEAFANEISEPKAVFYMDNQAFCSDPRTWQDDEDAYEELQLKWQQSSRTFDKLLQQIMGMSNTSTEAFKTMKELRDRLKSEIATISLDIANIQKVQDSLEAAQKALEKTGDQKNSFANFKQSETITLKKIVPADYHSTVCTTHLLQDIICHEGCGLEFIGQAGNDAFSGCACMGGGSTCTECGCGPEAHYHDMIQLEEKTETIEKVLEDIKAQYDMADQEFNKFSSDANNFQSTLDSLQAAADQKYKQIHQLCYDLSKICSRFNFVDELHANIENMKQEARVIKNTSLRKNAEDEISKLTKLANDLSVGQKKPNSSKANKNSSPQQIMNNFTVGSGGSSKKSKGFLKDLFRK